MTLDINQVNKWIIPAVAGNKSYFPAVNNSVPLPNLVNQPELLSKPEVGFSNFSSKEPTPGEVNEAVEYANKKMQIRSSSVSFEIDEITGKVIAKVVDRETQKVIREIPPEEFLEFVKRFDEIRSLLFKTEG